MNDPQPTGTQTPQMQRIVVPSHAPATPVAAQAKLAARGLEYAEITGEFAGRKDEQIQKFQSGRARVAMSSRERRAPGRTPRG